MDLATALAFARRRSAGDAIYTTAEHLLRWCDVTRGLSRHAVRGLVLVARHLVHGCSTLSDVSDGHGLRRLVAEAGVSPGARPAVHRLLGRARRHPHVDRDGRFASHADGAPRAFLDALPALYRYPGRFARWLARRSCTDSQTIVAFAERLSCGCPLAERDWARTRRTVALRVRTLVGALDECGQPVAPWLGVWCVREGHTPPPHEHHLRRLATLVALVVGRVQARDDGRRGRSFRGAASGAGALTAWLQFFRGAVRAGAFEPHLGPEDARSWALQRRFVQRRMYDLALLANVAPPQVLSAAPRPEKLRSAGLGRAPAASVDAAVLQRLWEAAADCARDRAVLAILASTGLRAEALARIRRQDAAAALLEAAAGAGSAAIGPFIHPDSHYYACLPAN